VLGGYISLMALVQRPDIFKVSFWCGSICECCNVYVHLMPTEFCLHHQDIFVVIYCDSLISTYSCQNWDNDNESEFV